MKIRRSAFTALVCAMFIFGFICRANAQTTSEYLENIDNIKVFEKIEVLDNINVVYTQDEDYSVAIDSKSKSIKVVSKAGKLIICRKKEMRNIKLDKDDKNKVYVSSPYLSKVEVKGSGNFLFQNSYSHNVPLSIEIEGSGNVNINNLDLEEIDMETSGSGNITCNGEIKSSVANIELSKSGNIVLNKLICPTTKVDLDGAGNIIIKNLDTNMLEAKVDGSGNMSLSGNCEVADYKLLGSGNIDVKNLTANSVWAKLEGSGNIVCFAKKCITYSKSGNGSLKWSGTNNAKKL